MPWSLRLDMDKAWGGWQWFSSTSPFLRGAVGRWKGSCELRGTSSPGRSPPSCHDKVSPTFALFEPSELLRLLEIKRPPTDESLWTSGQTRVQTGCRFVQELRRIRASFSWLCISRAMEARWFLARYFFKLICSHQRVSALTYKHGSFLMWRHRQLQVGRGQFSRILASRNLLIFNGCHTAKSLHMVLKFIP